MSFTEREVWWLRTFAAFLEKASKVADGRATPSQGGASSRRNAEEILHAAGRAGTTSTRAVASGASDEDMDGTYGDPVIRKDPKRWAGGSYVGRQYSKTCPEYLDEVASLLDWSARKKEETGETKKANYDRMDAARARGWAARMRAGKTPTYDPPEPVAAAAVDDPYADRGDAYEGDAP